MTPSSDPGPDADSFAREAEGRTPGLVPEFADFLLTNKKWWLLPIIVLLAGVTVLVFLSGTAAAPFIYTIF